MEDSEFSRNTLESLMGVARTSLKGALCTKRNESSPAETIGLWFGFILTVLSWVFIILTFPLSMCFCLKVIKEYERVSACRIHSVKDSLLLRWSYSASVD